VRQNKLQHFCFPYCRLYFTSLPVKVIIKFEYSDEDNHNKNTVFKQTYWNRLLPYLQVL